MVEIYIYIYLYIIYFVVGHPKAETVHIFFLFSLLLPGPVAQAQVLGQVQCGVSGMGSD